MALGDQQPVERIPVVLRQLEQPKYVACFDGQNGANAERRQVPVYLLVTWGQIKVPKGANSEYRNQYSRRKNGTWRSWKADEPAFAMPVKVGGKGQWQTIHPTTSWQTMKSGWKKDDFEVATDLYFVNVTKE